MLPRAQQADCIVSEFVADAALPSTRSTDDDGGDLPRERSERVVSSPQGDVVVSPTSTHEDQARLTLRGSKGLIYGLSRVAKYYNMSTSDVLWWLVYNGVSSLRNDPSFAAKTHKWFQDLSFLVERERIIVDYKPLMLKMGFHSRFNRWLATTSDWPLKNRLDASKRWLDEARLTGMRSNISAVRDVMRALRKAISTDRELARRVGRKRAIDEAVSEMLAASSSKDLGEGPPATLKEQLEREHERRLALSRDGVG